LSNYSPSFDRARSSVKKHGKTFFSFEYISEIIKIMKSDGAFLNHIRPEMLLTFDEYNENIRIRADHNQNVLDHYKKKDQDMFEM
jgi:hypothetical protein